MLNPQERHEIAIRWIKFHQRFGIGNPRLEYWLRENDEAVAAYYGYKTVAELELAVQTCWR